VTASHLVLAIDIGGTKLAAGLLDTSGSIVRSDSARTPSGDADAIWSALSALVEAVVGEVAPVGVGVGCGGPLRIGAGEVSPLNMPSWRAFPLVDRLRQRFPGVPVRLHNDAVTMAVGEHWRGAGRGASSLLGIVVSTGVGGGLVIGGRILGGRTGNAGHVGHVTVDPAGPSCGCGGRGCLEAIARGPAVVAAALAAGWKPTSDVVDGRLLVADAAGGDGACAAAICRAGEALGVALAAAAHLLELDRVVVGGGLAVGAGDLLLAPARRAYARCARMDFAARCEIVPAALGNDAGLVGAAALVLVPRYLTETEEVR
jgi:glucokinase